MTIGISSFYISLFVPPATESSNLPIFISAISLLIANINCLLENHLVYGIADTNE